DGARVFNAAAALSLRVSELTRGFDSLMFSLSKGLGAPVGSILLGTTEFIEEARQIRKMLGGAMRQAGILAAAGLLALTDGPLRLNLDHENARFLATGIAEVPGLRVFPEKIETNIVLLDTRDSSFDAPKFARMLANEGVLVNAIGP